MAEHDEDEIFVSTQWLEGRLNHPSLAIVDASWYLPTAGRDAQEEYLQRHIPGAVRFDIDTICDASSSLPHMLPDAKTFAAAASRLGLTTQTSVIVYDGAGLLAAPRVRWMLKIFGLQDVRVLDGGLPKWIAENRPLTSGLETRQPKFFQAKLDAKAVADLAQVRQALIDGSAQILDARPAARFAGLAPEPRPGVRSGHMPGAINVPSDLLIENGRLKSSPELIRIFEGQGVTPDRPIITSCGSGVTAAIVALALEQIGKPVLGLYDGSWSEWGSRADCPIATSTS